MDRKVNDINLGNVESQSAAPRPQDRTENGMAKAARMLGLIAIIMAVMGTIYVPMIIGVLAIIMAILSRTDDNLSRQAKTGLYLGTMAAMINIALVVYSFVLFSTDPQTHEQVNIMCENMYGQSFDAMLEDMKDGSMDLDYSYPFY